MSGLLRRSCVTCQMWHSWLDLEGTGPLYPPSVQTRAKQGTGAVSHTGIRGRSGMKILSPCIVSRLFTICLLNDSHGLVCPVNFRPLMLQEQPPATSNGQKPVPRVMSILKIGCQWSPSQECAFIGRVGLD